MIQRTGLAENNMGPGWELENSDAITASSDDNDLDVSRPARPCKAALSRTFLRIYYDPRAKLRLIFSKYQVQNPTPKLRPILHLDLCPQSMNSLRRSTIIPP